MKNKKILILIIITLFLYRLIISFFIPQIMVGTYYSNNKITILEGPSKFGEKLIIYPNGTFNSETWGNGKYEVVHSGIFSNEIIFTYSDQYGKAVYHTNIVTDFLGLNPKISLNSDLEFYFIKN
jgi:hypothetical protein